MSTVDRYWQGVARRILMESAVMNAVLSHNASVGEQNELALVRVVEKLLPARFAVASGLLLDSKDRQSAQTDLIIFDRVNQPAPLAQTGSVLFPIEVTNACIEVKSRTRLDDLRDDFPKKMRKLHALEPGSSQFPAFGFFSFSASAGPAAILSALEGLPLEDRPDFGCVVDPGIFWSKRPTWRAGFVLLPEDEEAATLSGCHWRRCSDPSGVVVDGIQFPSLAHRASATHYYVGDPGRTMTLFAMALWQSLGSEKFDWLGAYFPNQYDSLVTPADLDC